VQGERGHPSPAYTRALRRIETRVKKLLEQLRAGTYRAPRKRARNPGGFAWMDRLLPYNGTLHWCPHSAGFLNMILQQDPEIQEFAKTCPALARQLRPLCHMLGVTQPDYLKLPPRARKPRPRKPKREKREKFAPYKYAMRTGTTFGGRLRRFAKKTTHW
jgi:hypothetical protein